MGNKKIYRPPKRQAAVEKRTEIKKFIYSTLGSFLLEEIFRWVASQIRNLF